MSHIILTAPESDRVLASDCKSSNAMRCDAMQESADSGEGPRYVFPCHSIPP